MPEGPEIRTICSALAPIIVGSRLGAIRWSDKSKKHKLFDNYRLLSLPCTIQAITCRGKKIVFFLEGPAFLTSTLGMSGRWCWDKGNNSHLWLELDIGILWYDDARRFGNLELWFDYSAMIAKLTKEIGPDLLLYSLQIGGFLLEEEKSHETIDLPSWLSVINDKRLGKWPVCRFLLEQKYFSGIGNYLKCEILYRARIAPNRILACLTQEEATRLWEEALDTIRESYLAGGLTISTYWDPNGNRGSFYPKVYNRTRDDDGSPVIKGSYGDGRSTYWCPSVQQ
jgi:formamidopyrimidine-DNA glycosylase